MGRNKSGEKGTGYENHVKDTYLTPVWPTAERARLKGINDYGDFINVGPYLVEAKKRKRLWGEIIGWVDTVLIKVRRAAHTTLLGLTDEITKRDILDVADELYPWFIIMAGDKRKDPNIDLMMLPATLGMRAIEALERQEGRL